MDFWSALKSLVGGKQVQPQAPHEDPIVPELTIPDSLFIETHRTLPISHNPFSQIQGISADVRQRLESAFRDSKGATLQELSDRAGFILWGQTYHWPIYDEWDTRFAEQGRWPVMWDHEEPEEEDEPEASPVSSSYSQPLPAKLAALVLRFINSVMVLGLDVSLTGEAF